MFLSILVVTAAVACAMPLNAATQAVYDVPTRPGVYNRILVNTPDAPVATVLLFAGGNGVLQLGSDGSIGALSGNFLIRSRDLFVAQGFTVVLVDAPSDRVVGTVGLSGFRQTPDHATDIAAVIDYVGQLRSEPLWLVGTSNGTLSVGFLSFTLPQSIPFGIVLTSSILASDASTRDLIEMPLEGNQRATLVVHNLLDQCGSCPPASVPTLMQHLTAAPVRDSIMFNGGDTPTSGPCEARSYHGFLGIESQVVSSIGSWIIAHPPVVDAALQVARGWNLLGNSLNLALTVANAFSDASSVLSVWKWDSSQTRWQFYSSRLDSAALQAYAAGKGYDVLSTINPGDGYWVYALTQSSASLQGTPFNLTSLNLVTGWNLVATGSDVTPPAFNMSLSSTPPVAGTVPLNIWSLWAWDSASSTWYYYAPNLEAQGGTALSDYITSKSFLDFTQNGKTLGKGAGFWVNK